MSWRPLYKLSLHCVQRNKLYLRRQCGRKKETERVLLEMAMSRNVDIDDLPKNAANYTALTPLWFLDRAALVHPARASVVHGARRYTWRDTYERCRRLASALTNHSIGLGKTVSPIPVVIHYFLYSNRPQ